jgi:diguanylate cyclase (GGDEF)-like protein/PAS domain S-box-containing protein
VDFWKSVAAEAGLEYTIRVLPFNQVLQEFKEGKIDVLINLAISDERRQFADFSVPHVVVNGAIFVHKDKTGILSEDDLSGQSIIVLNADLAHDYAVSKGWAKQLVLVDTVAEGMKLLASGKHDAMLLSKLVGMQSIQNLGLANLKPLKAPAGFSQKFAFAVPKGQSDLLGRINEAMAITNTNGIYTEHYDKWFGVYEDKELELRHLLKYIGPIIALFLAVLLYFHYQQQAERKLAQERLHASEQRFRSLVNSQSDLISRFTADGILTFVNDSYVSFMGNGKSKLLERSIYQDIPLEGRELVKAALSELSVEKPRKSHENTLVSAAGECRTIEWINHGIFDSSQTLTEIQSVGRDVTAIREYQNEVLQAHGELERIAHYDVLTNLPNRALLADRLNHAIVQCQRRNESLAVTFMDIDDFKAVNDTYGHELGDKLLVELSKRMKQALREGDTLARIGGDEFIAVMVDLNSIESCKPVLERLLKATNEPVTVDDTVLQVSASIGVTLYPQDGVDADQLMRHADQAMYIAKQAGKNRYQLFDAAQDSAIKIQQQSIGDVRSALGRREFVLHYQPKVNMHTGDVIGVEALIRWQHPDRGLVPPLDFLPAIEGHAISLELGEWVMDTALIQISQLRSMGVDLPISVNISAYQLQQDNFVTRLEGLLAAHPKIDPHYLELEILETSKLSDISQVLDTMNACHGLGVRFALDDFGTGYSSLTHIKRLPAYLIKIDQSFVRDMLEDIDDLAIVESVIGLAKTFKREVIAEGVETIAHGLALLELGCELAQGYGIARPMPAGDIPEWVSSWKADDSWQTHLQIVSDTVHLAVHQTIKIPTTKTEPHVP